MKNEYRRYLILIGLISLAYMLLLFVCPDNEPFYWFLVNFATVILYFFLQYYYKKNSPFFSAILSLPLILFVASLLLGFFNFIDDKYINFFLYSMISSPILLTIGGFLQPRKLHG